MAIKKIFRTLVLLTVIFTVSSCATALEALKLVFSQPEVTIGSFNFQGMSEGNVNFNLILNVNNPNSVGINTSQIDYNLDINQHDIISGVLNRGLEIKANGTSSVEVPIQVSLQKLLPVLSSVFQDINNVDYKVYGKINFDTPVGVVPIPWQKQDKIAIPRLF